MSKVVLTLGTKKGMFVLESDEARKEWKQTGALLPGVEINHAMLDTRDGAFYATDNNPWFGPRVGVSSDWGATWTYAENGPKFPEASGKSVARGWRLTPGAVSQPGVVYCGVDPASMFVTRDGGKTWEEDRG